MGWGGKSTKSCWEGNESDILTPPISVTLMSPLMNPSLDGLDGSC